MKKKSPKAESPPSTTDATVLVADDDPDILALVTTHLRSLGVTILEASDGESALATVKKQKPALVVLDVMMPGMTGWEVCRAIRDDEALSSVRVLMLTGIGERLNEMTSPLYGADDFIDKPFELGELDAKIRKILAGKRRSA